MIDLKGHRFEKEIILLCVLYTGTWPIRSAIATWQK